MAPIASRIQTGKRGDNDTERKLLNILNVIQYF